ncbi:MAG: MFS transporter [Planctomycetaceae bacterium]|nr:MFS transporter [Planctomycetaceae bacterium]
MADLGGLTPENAVPESEADRGKPWYRLLNRYHVFVLVVAALGWLFDCLDQQLFILARPAAMKELVVAEDYPKLSADELNLKRRQMGDYATSIFIAGWACGGLLFGMLGDKIGRAKTMFITILMYSLCTGLSAFSTGVWDFSFYRFLTGLGVGGEFAVGVALVAEVMPGRARPYCLGLLQALSAIGNVSAALINLQLGLAAEQGLPTSPWRIMFMVGAVPALLALVVRGWLKEPEKWQQAQEQKKDDTTPQHALGTYGELFSHPTWRKHAILGLLLGCSGIIGLWSVGFFAPDLIRYVQTRGVTEEVYEEELARAEAAGESQIVDDVKALKAALEDSKTEVALGESAKKLKEELGKRIEGKLAGWSSFTSIAINIGAFLGMFGFGNLAQVIGRKPTFAIGFVAALVSTVSVFLFLEDFWQVVVLVPIMGFCQLSLFAGYAIYFPELFPTRLRSTGTSFCYNVGRFLAALGPVVKAQLEAFFHNPDDRIQSLRYAGVTMCSVFLIGLLVLPFLPETKDQPLPE